MVESRMRRWAAAFLTFTAAAACAQKKSDPNPVIRMNQIQVIGTHNSYHSDYLPGIAKVLQKDDPDSFNENEYSHVRKSRYNFGTIEGRIEWPLDP